MVRHQVEFRVGKRLDHFRRETTTAFKQKRHESGSDKFFEDIADPQRAQLSAVEDGFMPKGPARPRR